jgi:hypothetical protein
LEPKEVDYKVEIKFTLYYEEIEPIFWHVYKELLDKGNGVVEHDKLQERLISTGKFFASDAFMMIEYIEQTGKIEQTEHTMFIEWRPRNPKNKLILSSFGKKSGGSISIRKDRSNVHQVG